jgi:hypothetical protein
MRKLSNTLLGQLVAAAATANPVIFSTEKDMKELLDAGLADMNSAINDGKGNIAFKASAKALANPAQAQSEATAKPTFVIKSNIALPKIARLNGGNNSGSKYPIADLEPGQSFFIPAPSDMKSPSKSFGSLVAAANKKYAKADDFRHFTTRSAVGDDWEQPGVKGIAIFRHDAAEEAALKAKAFPATPAAA